MGHRGAPSSTSLDTSGISMLPSPIVVSAGTRPTMSAQGGGLRQSRQESLRIDPGLRRVRSVIPGGPQS
jgi:hypothetical protein